MTRAILDRINIGRVLITSGTLIYSFVGVMDIVLIHRGIWYWPPYYRFHGVWLISLSGAIVTFTLYLLWWPVRNRIERVRIAGFISLLAVASHLLAVFSGPFYGGSFYPWAKFEKGVLVPEGLFVNILVEMQIFAAILILIGMVLTIRLKSSS